MRIVIGGVEEEGEEEVEEGGERRTEWRDCLVPVAGSVSCTEERRASVAAVALAAAGLIVALVLLSLLPVCSTSGAWCCCCSSVAAEWWSGVLGAVGRCDILAKRRSGAGVKGGEENEGGRKERRECEDEKETSVGVGVERVRWYDCSR